MVHVLTGAVSWPSMMASSHASLDVALIIIAVVVVAKIFFLRSRGGLVRVDGQVIARCSQGHVFPTAWFLGAFTSIRLGNARYMRCPVGNHWSLVRPVKQDDLTDEERRSVGLDGTTGA
jgi:hypothetical protein